MAPVTPVFMRVLRPRCYRTSHAVYGIATSRLLCFLLGFWSYRTSHAVYGIATSKGELGFCFVFERYRTSHAVYGIATPSRQKN